MVKRPFAVGILIACAFSLGAQQRLEPVAPKPSPTLYQIDLVSSEKLLSLDLPVLKGTVYLFHQYPTGTLISVRKSTVKQVGKMSPAAIAAAIPTTARTVANVAMSRSARIVGCSNTGNNFAAFVAYTVLTAATAVVPSNQISTPVRKPTYGPNANST